MCVWWLGRILGLAGCCFHDIALFRCSSSCLFCVAHPSSSPIDSLLFHQSDYADHHDFMMTASPGLFLSPRGTWGSAMKARAVGVGGGSSGKPSMLVSAQTWLWWVLGVCACFHVPLLLDVMGVGCACVCVLLLLDVVGVGCACSCIFSVAVCARMW